MATQASRDGRLAAVLERLRGRYEVALTRTVLVEALGIRGLRAAVKGGALVELLPRVFVAGGRENEHAVRCKAVLVWGRGRLTISGASALHLAHERFGAPGQVHAIGTVPHHAHAPDWLRIRRTAVPDIAALYQGVRCAPPEIAVLDAWRSARPSDRENLLYVALWSGVVRPESLLTWVRTMPRVAARALLEGILGEFEAGARSPGEVLARRRVFVGAEWADLERSAHFTVAGRDRYPDLVHRRARVIIECDGEAYHGPALAVAADRERDADFLAIGYVTIRLSFNDLLTRPAWCRDKVRAVIANRLVA